MAHALRGSMGAAEYKHVVLGLSFLKYISDAFEELHEATEAEGVDDPEDLDVYRAKNIFWVPPAARWTHLQSSGETVHNRSTSGQRHVRPSSATTRRSLMSCRRTTRVKRSTSSGLDS